MGGEGTGRERTLFLQERVYIYIIEMYTDITIIHDGGKSQHSLFFPSVFMTSTCMTTVIMCDSFSFWDFFGV